MVALAPFTWKDVSYDIEVTNDGKFFSPQVKTRFCDNYNEVVESIKKAHKKATVKVSVPFVGQDGQKFSKAVATGIHATTGEVLVLWEDGHRSAIPGRLAFSADMPVEEAQRRHDALIAAERSWRIFTSKYGAKVMPTLRAEIEKATQEAMKTERGAS